MWANVCSREPSLDPLLSPLPPRRPGQSDCKRKKAVSCQHHEWGWGGGGVCSYRGPSLSGLSPAALAWALGPGPPGVGVGRRLRPEPAEAPAAGLPPPRMGSQGGPARGILLVPAPGGHPSCGLRVPRPRLTTGTAGKSVWG